MKKFTIEKILVFGKLDDDKGLDIGETFYMDESLTIPLLQYGGEISDCTDDTKVGQKVFELDLENHEVDLLNEEESGLDTYVVESKNYRPRLAVQSEIDLINDYLVKEMSCQEKDLITLGLNPIVYDINEDFKLLVSTQISRCVLSDGKVMINFNAIKYAIKHGHVYEYENYDDLWDDENVNINQIMEILK